MQLPILYSFRRCPYAMRARMALIGAEIELEHREIILKNKPPQMLEASPKGTVPVLVLPDQTVIDESLDVMLWALRQNDPQRWLGHNECHLDAAMPLIRQCDGEFKRMLDRYKYADRHPEPAEVYRNRGLTFLGRLNALLGKNRYLIAEQIAIADIAITPFIRQFAHVDKAWFLQTGLAHLIHWLDTMLGSALFAKAMQKYPLWSFHGAGTSSTEMSQ